MTARRSVTCLLCGKKDRSSARDGVCTKHRQQILGRRPLRANPTDPSDSFSAEGLTGPEAIQTLSTLGADVPLDLAMILGSITDPVFDVSAGGWHYNYPMLSVDQGPENRVRWHVQKQMYVAQRNTPQTRAAIMMLTWGREHFYGRKQGEAISGYGGFDPVSSDKDSTIIRLPMKHAGT